MTVTQPLSTQTIVAVVGSGAMGAGIERLGDGSWRVDGVGVGGLRPSQPG